MKLAATYITILAFTVITCAYVQARVKHNIATVEIAHD